MVFDCEKQMAEPAEEWLRSRGMMTKREFTLPWGILDLVGCSLNQRHVMKRVALGQTRPIGPHERIMILAQIPDVTEGTAVTKQKLTRIFRGLYDERGIAAELSRLMAGKFVSRTRQDGFQRVNGWMPLQRRIIALELKLARVSDAVAQAVRHLSFADESYVGLPIDTAYHVLRSRQRLTFDENGIGLIAVCRDGCRVLLKSRPAGSELDPLLQAHCVERFWRDRLRGS